MQLPFGYQSAVGMRESVFIPTALEGGVVQLGLNIYLYRRQLPENVSFFIAFCYQLVLAES